MYNSLNIREQNSLGYTMTITILRYNILCVKTLKKVLLR